MYNKQSCFKTTNEIIKYYNLVRNKTIIFHLVTLNNNYLYTYIPLENIAKVTTKHIFSNICKVLGLVKKSITFI